MKIPSLLILSAIYIPLFGCIHPIVRYNFKTVSYILIITIGFFYLHRSYFLKIKGLNNNSIFSEAFRPFLVMNLCLIFLGALHVYTGKSTIPIYSGSLHGIFLSMAIIYYLSTFSDTDISVIFERIASFVVIAFIVQFFFSYYESVTGQIIAQGYDWLNEAIDYYTSQTMSRRLIFNVFGIDLASALSLKVAFSGLLGQHNYWGTQLPFYNLIFWTQYFKNRERRYLLLLSLVLLASILNTSRFGIFAILATDIFLLNKFVVNKKHFLKISCLLLFISVLASYGDILSIRSKEYFDTTNTLYGRIINYKLFLGNLFNRDIYEILFGSGTLGVERFMIRALGHITSFESQFFATLIGSGLTGLGFLIYFLAKIVKQSFGFPSINKELGILLVFNFVMVSLISNLAIHYSTYAFVTLIYVYIAISHPTAFETT